ncbi:MAG: hypothetical protein R3E01_34120 [Pirellulaceae bacterium]|nr:hypothetical protein [Planctomycetales bacterium]
MAVNFFAWIREGVRQSILMGVADAVDQIGAPQRDPGLRQQLTEAIENGPLLAAPAGSERKPTRKRLGRSLKEIQADDSGTK